MPFKSNSQRKACWAQWNRDKKAGKKPRWNCKEWEDYPDNGPNKPISMFYWFVSPWILIL